MNLFSHSITNSSLRKNIFFVCVSIFNVCTFGCSSKKPSVEDQLNNATIAYPFVDENYPIGINQYEAPFVIRSATGKTEYTIEIPGGAKNYDVEVPLAEMESDLEEGGIADKNASNIKPQITDRELVAMMPKAEDETSPHLTDAALGVAELGGPQQSPSYTLGIHKINQIFKERKFELALIEINNLSAFYPTSAQLQKMKGTVLLKLKSNELALRAFERAFELDNSDTKLAKMIDKLKKESETVPATSDAGKKDKMTPPVSALSSTSKIPPLEQPNNKKQSLKKKTL